MLALEKIRRMAPWYRRERRSGLVYNPATGALEVSADLRRKVRKAIAAELRAIKLRLYLHLTNLYFRKLLLAVKSAFLNVVSDLNRCLFYLNGRRHG